MVLIQLSLTTIYFVFAIVLLHVVGGFAWVMVKISGKSGKAKKDEKEKEDVRD